VITIAPKDEIVFEEAIARTLIMVAYFGLLVGRPQRVLELYLRTTPESDMQMPLRVYWSMPPKRRPSHEKRNPHPADVRLDAVRQPEMFSRVLANWLERHQEWRDARQRFFDSFAKQRRYPIDRLTASANMFDILPNSAVPSKVELPANLKAAKSRARRIFRTLPPESGTRECTGRSRPSGKKQSEAKGELSSKESH
jgi:hypothetical protein